MIVRKLYRWSIDRINGRFISGWCFNRLHKTRSITIVAAADKTILGEFSNTGYRPDLIDLKLHPSGVCAFDFSFPADFDPGLYNKFYLYFDSHKTPVVTIDCRDIKLLRPQQQDPVCFMHIPKTAGTSFNSFARNCFSGDRFRTHIERFDRDQRADFVSSVDYLSGHLPFYELQKLPNIETFDFYSIIRKPYAHLHSHLNYVRGVRPGSGVELHYTYHHNETIKGLSDKLNRLDFSNPDSIKTFVAGLVDYERDFFDNIQTRYFLDRRPVKVVQSDLDQAKQNLDHFCSVGLTENYDAFSSRFCGDLGLEFQKQDLESNKSSFYRLFDLSDQAIREALQPLVAFDIELYEYVLEKFW